ncbi:diguanylate cyclase (GGDEF) domain-containing protein [Rheinheimera pacifica]|uniref:diguanylate cyclase n=1 Tax=Rheinheimera pacifica TaxID=173990 RepID=A0A1H6N8E4_9GAMM|nr:diguanylate cyclase [Rheinheimera pacifica]SEI11010.1 diguanylate cyclase (GGDEF) domain-containing protein [Rheinheimera pacifica]
MLLKPYISFVWLFFVSLYSTGALAQSQQFDALVKQIERGERPFFSIADYQQALLELETAMPANDSKRSSMLNRLRCTLAYFDKPEQGISFSDEKLSQAKAQQDHEALADYYVCRYYLYSQLGQTQLAEQNAQLSYDAASASENPLSIAISLSLLGNIASYRGNYADAMQHYVSAYQLQLSLGYQSYISDVVLAIAATYRRMGLYQEALNYLQQAEQEFSAPQEQFRLAMILNEKAFSYAEMNQPQQALELFEQALQAYKKLNEPLWQTYIKVNLVWVYNLLQQYDNALAFHRQALEELNSSTVPDQSSLATYKGLLALYHSETLLALQQPEDALHQVTLAEHHLSTDDNPRYLLMRYQVKAKALAASGDTAAAYQMLQRYVTLNQQQQQQAKEQQSNLLRIQFDSAHQQEHNQQLAAEKALMQRHVSTLQLAQRWQYVALSLIALLLLILFIAALSLKRRNRRLHNLAMTDELTGIANRRRIMLLAEQERVKARDTALPLSFLILDLDHFKQVNDRYGHEAGDLALQQFSLTVSSLLREQDHFGRTGGEEFLIVLPDTELQHAEVIAERLRSAVAAICVSNSKNPFSITCSLGITQSRPDELLNITLGRADDALYQAKDEGRNRAVSLV